MGKLLLLKKVLLKQIAKLLKKNKHFFCYFFMQSKTYLFSLLQLLFIVKYFEEKRLSRLPPSVFFRLQSLLMTPELRVLKWEICKH